MRRRSGHWAAALALGLSLGCAPAPRGEEGGLERLSQALSMHQADLVASDGLANDDFGLAVAISGDTAIVGTLYADDEEGAAYVFVRTGSTWTQQQRLAPATSDGKDWFGRAVAIDGDTALIGAPHQTDSVKQTWTAGRAFIFTRAGSTWTQSAILTASPRQTTDNFGHSVALAGDIAVVGAPGYDVGGVLRDQGLASVFRRVGDTWTRIEELYAADRAFGDSFGTQVAASADAILVGAPYADIGTGSPAIDQGAIYTYTRAGDVFAFDKKITLADGTSTNFGASVRLSGTTALIGAPRGLGAVHAFERVSTGWAWQGDLLALADVPGIGPAYGVAISGATALLGLPYDKAGTSVTQGVAYRFTREGSTWSYRERLTDENDGANRLFGYAVALSARTAVVGAPGDTVGANQAQGAAHVFGLEGDQPCDNCPSGGAGGTSGQGGVSGQNSRGGQGGASDAGGAASGGSAGRASGGADAGAGRGSTSDGGRSGSSTGGGGRNESTSGAAGSTDAGGSDTTGGNSAPGDRAMAGEAGAGDGARAPTTSAGARTSERGGCGCRVSSASVPSVGRAWLLGLLLALLLRRRKI